MAKTSEMIPSNYLKQSDFPEDYIVTVVKVERKNIAMEGKPAEYKWLMSFREFDKPMVLNSTNIHAMEKACGSDDTDDWIGKEVIVYVDENVSFGGELVGGLRIKKHKAATAPVSPRTTAATPARTAAPVDDEEPDPRYR
jgi:hypothetical protein